MATYYFRNTGTNWNLTASWSSTASPTYTNVATVPGIADTALFEAASANCTITTVAAAADRIDFTNGGTSNYTGLLTVGTNTAGTLTLSRSLALSPVMSNVTGSADVIISTATTCAITSSGKSIHRLYYTSGTSNNATLNLADTLTIEDIIQTTYTNGAPSITFNDGDVVIRKTGLLYINNRGTSAFYISPLTGQTASFTNVGGDFTMTNNLIISGSGRVNFDNILAYTTGKITYATASDITFTNNHNLFAINCSLDTGGMTWNRHDTNSGATITNIISSSLNISGSFSFSNSAYIITPSGSARVNAYGNINLPTVNGINIPLTITGSASGRTLTALQGLTTNSDVEFKLTGGSITVSPSAITTIGGTQAVRIRNNSTGGTIIASGSTITTNNGANLSLDTNTILWGGLTLNGTSNIITLSSSLLLSGSLTFGLNGGAVFTGSAGWTCANLLCSTANRTLQLANSSSGATYRTTTNASLLGTAAQRIIMTSDNATTQSIWTLDNGAQQSLVYVNGTRIDSSQGSTIWSFGGTLTNTTNWGTGSAPVTTAYTYVC
jgi:hypothetical protein